MKPRLGKALTKAEMDEAFMRVISQQVANNIAMWHPSVLMFEEWDRDPKAKRRFFIEGGIFFALMVGAIIAAWWFTR